MATPSIVQSTKAQNGSGNTISCAFSSAVTAGNALIVGIRHGGTSTMNVPTDTQGNTYTLLNTITNAGGTEVALYGAVAASSGANTVTATFVGGSNSGLALVEIANVASLTVDATAQNTGASTTSLTLGGSMSPTTHANEIAIGFAGVGTAATTVPSPSVGWTDLQNNATTGPFDLCYQLLPSSGVTTPNTWTWSGVAGAAGVIVTLQGTSSGSTVSLTGSVASSSSTTGTESAIAFRSGTVSGSSTISGSAGATVFLSASLPGSGAISGSPTGPPVSLSGSVAGVSALSGARSAIAFRSGAVSGSGAVTASPPSLAVHLAGTILGASAAAATPTARLTLTAALAGSGTATGLPARFARLAAALAGSSALAAVPTRSLHLTATLTGSGSTTLLLTIVRPSSPGSGVTTTLAGSGAIDEADGSGTIDEVFA